jgi:HEAT repeat protein
LEPLLKDPSEEVRYAAARSLCQIGDARGREFLQKALGQPDAFGRADAAEIVGQLQLPWVTETLVGLLKDAAAPVVVRAARALASRNDPRGLQALVMRSEAATGDDRADYEAALAELGVTESKRLQILQAKHAP